MTEQVVLHWMPLLGLGSWVNKGEGKILVWLPSVAAKCAPGYVTHDMSCCALFNKR